jgi:hypothetical protein
LITPDSSFGGWSAKYRLTIQPESGWLYQELEHMAIQLKAENKSPYKLDIDCYREYSDQLIKGCEVLFETLLKPKLVGDFSDLDSDEKLLGKFCQVVGHMQIHKYGNVYLSMHIVEPALLL